MCVACIDFYHPGCLGGQTALENERGGSTRHAHPISFAFAFARSRRPQEYYQWSPSHNENSKQHTVNAGDLLYGSITYVPATDSYDVYHKNMADGWDVTMNVRRPRFLPDDERGVRAAACDARELSGS